MSNLRIELDQRLAAFEVSPTALKAERLRAVLEAYKNDVTTLAENIDDLAGYLETYQDADDKEERDEAKETALGLVADVISNMDELS